MAIRRLFVILFLILSLCACNREKTVGIFYVRNDTDLDLYMETNIESQSINSHGFSFNLLAYADYSDIEIARSKPYKDEKDNFDIGELVWNNDAYVKVFRIIGQDTLLLKEWKYQEKDSAGRQLFDLSYSIQSGYQFDHGQSGDIGSCIYIFSIQSEDLLYREFDEITQCISVPR